MDLLSESLGFSFENSFAESRQTIIAAPFVVQLGIGTHAGFFDESHFFQPAQCAVQRAGP
jgi:hypothetical protein